jgi:hypothetical protein
LHEAAEIGRRALLAPEQVWYGAGMASPQDSPTRKKQKIRARRRLADWRKKQEAGKSGSSGQPSQAAAR